MTMATIACEHCDAPNPAKSRFCRRCGKPLADPLVRSATRLSPLMEKWRRLTLQTTRKELRAHLGEPLRIDAGQDSAQAIERWVYEYETANGSGRRVDGEVSVSSEGRVIGWREPEWKQLDRADSEPAHEAK